MRETVPVRMLAAGLSLNRIAFGLAYLLAPGRSGPSWVGSVAEDPATQVFIRGHGARDVGLGVGALAPLKRGDYTRAREWLAAQALADGADVIATLAARRRLPAAGFRFALAVASGSTVIGAVSAVVLGRE